MTLLSSLTVLCAITVSLFSTAGAVPQAADPCAKIAGKTFVPPADALACEKSFPFNETLRQNVLTNIARVFDFYTFEDYYLASPPPFQESTNNIRATLARINKTSYAVRLSQYANKQQFMVLLYRRTMTSVGTCTISRHN